MKDPTGPGTRAMIFPWVVLCRAGRQALGLLLVPAEVGTEVMGQLVGVSVRMTNAIWGGLLNIPTRSETPGRERTTEGRHPVPRPVAEGTEPARWPRPAADRPAAQPSPEESLARTALGAGTTTGTVDVTFRLPAAVGAHSAHVCGEFNDWSTTADPMDRRDDGSFELVRTLPVGRRWRFRYLLDGDRWENDWTADDYAPNAFGDHDSVVDLRTPSTSRLVIGHRPGE